MEQLERQIYRKYLSQLDRPDSASDCKAHPIQVDLLLKHYTCFLFDGFGTLYEKDKLYDDSLEFLQRLRAEHKQVRLISNTASRTIKDIQQDLWDKGLELHPQEIITSGSLLSLWNSKVNLSEAFHLGKPTAEPLLRDANIKITDTPSQNVVILTGLFPGEEAQEEAKNKAIQILSKENAILLVANPDVMAPKDGTKYPVAGALAEELIKITGCNSNFLGKPFPLIYQKALYSFMPVLAPVVMIGDTPGTDIAGAASQEIDSALLLRGNSAKWTEEFWEEWMFKPNYVLKNLSST